MPGNTTTGMMRAGRSNKCLTVIFPDGAPDTYKNGAKAMVWKDETGITIGVEPSNRGPAGFTNAKGEHIFQFAHSTVEGIYLLPERFGITEMEHDNMGDDGAVGLLVNVTKLRPYTQIGVKARPGSVGKPRSSKPRSSGLVVNPDLRTRPGEIPIDTPQLNRSAHAPEDQEHRPPNPDPQPMIDLERNGHGKFSLGTIVKALNKMKDECGEQLRFSVDENGHLVIEKVTLIRYG